MKQTQSKKNILSWYYPHLNFWMGGTKFIFEVLSRLAVNNQTIIVCNGGKTEVIQKFTEANICVESLLSLNSNSMFYWLLYPLVLPIELIRAKKTFLTASINIATLFPSNLVYALLSKIYKKTYYYYCFEPFPFLQNKQFINSFPFIKRILLHLLRLMYAPLDSWATRQAEIVFTLNQVTQRMIKNTYGVDSVVTLMGVDSNHFKPQNPNKISTRFKDHTVITHSTDYTTMKRTDLALQTFAHVVKKHPNARLVITSTQPDSPESKKYQSLASHLKIDKYVDFLGLIPYEDLPKYYAASVCLLSCSHDEMLGTTSSNLPVKEALACGVPAIRANITHEDVVDGVSGFLVDPRDSKAVAEKIIYLIEHPKESEQMGQNGRQRILSEYKWADVIDKLVTGINGAVNHD